MSTLKPLYSSSIALFGSTALDSLASSSSLLAGNQCAPQSNSTPLYGGGLLSGKFKANNTAPTAGKIEVWAGCVLNDTPDYPDVFDGTGGAKTITSADIKNAALVLVKSIPTDANANRIYPFSGIPIEELFGFIPLTWFVFVTHNMVQALNTTSGAGGQVWFKPHNIQSV